MVFDAPRTAALQSCLLRTEGSGLGSLAEPPVLGVKPVEKKVVSSVSKDEASCVKFIVGSDSSEDEDDPWQGLDQRRQEKRKRQKSEGSSGVSTRMSTSISNASSSFASNFSADIDEDEELESVDGDDALGISSPVDASSAFFNTVAPTSVVVEQSNVLHPSASVKGPHLHEMSYLSVNPASALKIKWPYFVCGEFMVFHVPATTKSIGVQDALITLLEYGEKNFQCSYAVVLIEQGRVDKTSLERTFTFLGFHNANPNELSNCLKDCFNDHVVMISDFSDLCDDSDDADCESLFDE